MVNTSSAATDFGVWRTDTDDQVVVGIVGELDMETAPTAWEVLVQEFEHGDLAAIDLSGLTFMDSSGLKVLLNAHRRSTRDGRLLVLRSPQPQVRKVLEVTALDKVFEIEDGRARDHAVAKSTTTITPSVHH